MSLLDLTTLTPEQFEPLIGQMFGMTGAGAENLAVELLKVRIVPHQPPRGFRQQFSVEFRSAPGTVLGQGTFVFTHDTFGRAEFLVTPVQSSERGNCYVGVFG